MTISAGGSSGIVFPDSTTLPASEVTAYLSPGLTDTANVLTANPTAKPVQFNGTTGVTVNGATLSSASGFYPVNTVLPAITGTTRDTQVLTCSTGTWSNSPTSYSYQWIRGTSTNVGTNSSTYTCVTADIGSTIKCTVTATNGVGSNSTTSSPVGPITANTYTLTYFIAGGGGGGSNGGGTGGGGAGGAINSSTTATPGTLYTITVGGGGAAASSGSATVISGVATQNGGGGGSYGGSGAQGGTSGNGNAGNSGNPSQGYYGGGGGSGGAAGNRDGGPGTATSITGSSVTYAGGGGGGNSGWDSPGSGAAGGGNGGFYNIGNNPTSAGANTGSGGGGSSFNAPQGGGSGGSGKAILSMPTSSYSGTYTNATVSTNGSNTVLTFTSSGTYTA